LRQVQDECDGHEQGRHVSRYPENWRPAGIHYAQRAAGGRWPQHHDSEEVAGTQTRHGGDEQQCRPEHLNTVEHRHGPFRIGPGPDFWVVSRHGQYGPCRGAEVHQQVGPVAVPAHRAPEPIQRERYQ